MTSAADDPNRPLPRLTLRDEASRRLRSEIVAGGLEAGLLYPIAQGAERLGVSITPGREALLELSSEGLVEIVRNRGFRISEVSEKDLDEIVEMRLLLEVPVVQRLAERAETLPLAPLRDLATQLKKAAAK